MLHKTRGLVLHHIRYSESSLIVKIYTEAFGVQSYLVKVARSKRGALRNSMFQPMTLLELVVYNRAKSDLQHIREAGVSEAFHSISSDLRKSTIAIFLAELLLKTLKDGEANEELFEFLYSSLHFFDMQSEGIENFHLYFLVQLSRFLGFNPQGEPSGDHSYFDLREGKFTDEQISHSDRIEGPLGQTFYVLTQATAADLSKMSVPRIIRIELLDALLIYYQIHLTGLGTIRSVEVLREVFS